VVRGRRRLIPLVRPWIGRDRERREEEEEGGLARPGRRRELARDGRYSEI
jgi:hypothetical protein